MPVYVLIGPNRGKSGNWGGITFKDGACNLTRQQAELDGPVLSNFYSAFPEEEAEAKQAEYEASQSENPPVAPVAPVVPVVPEETGEGTGESGEGAAGDESGKSGEGAGESGNSGDESGNSGDESGDETKSRRRNRNK